MVDKTALFAYSVSCLNKVADALVRVSSGACAGFLNPVWLNMNNPPPRVLRGDVFVQKPAVLNPFEDRGHLQDELGREAAYVAFRGDGSSTKRRPTCHGMVNLMPGYTPPPVRGRRFSV